MSRNLITGGLGFLGSNLARQLLKQDQEVLLFDVIPSSKLIEDIRKKVEIVRGDLGNWAEVLDAVRGNRIERIYHIGAVISEAAEDRPATAYMVNANGTFHVLEAARMFGASVVFASSTATFGPGLSHRVNEDTVQRPISMYGVTKAFAEKLGEYYHRKCKVNFRATRFPSVLGPGRRGGFTAYSSLMIEELAMGRQFIVPVGEATQMACLYYKDAVLSLIQLGEADETRLKRRVYNVQSFSTTMEEVASAVKRYLPEAQIEFRPPQETARVTGAQVTEVDDTNARQDWGWKPQYDLEEAVRDFVAEVMANRGLHEAKE